MNEKQLDGVGLEGVRVERGESGEASKAGAMEPIWGDGRSPKRQCVAHRKNGDRCRRVAILGGTVCPTHGGSSPHVKRAARARLENAADRMARELLSMAESDDVSAAVKLAAIRDALDRAGLSARTAIDVEVGPSKEYEVLLTELAMVRGGSRAASRASRGIEDEPLDAELVAELDHASGIEHAPHPAHGAQYPHLDTAGHRQAGTGTPGGGVGAGAPARGRKSDYSGTPIVSLGEAHPSSRPGKKRGLTTMEDALGDLNPKGGKRKKGKAPKVK